MNVDFKGINENVATFVADETVEAGMFVKIIGDGTVGACSSNDEIIGLCVNVRDGYAAVQISGYMEANTTSSMGTGYIKFLANDPKTITPGTSSRSYLVVCSKDNKIGFIL